MASPTQTAAGRFTLATFMWSAWSRKREGSGIVFGAGGKDVDHLLPCLTCAGDLQCTHRSAHKIHLKVGSSISKPYPHCYPILPHPTFGVARFACRYYPYLLSIPVTPLIKVGVVSRVSPDLKIWSPYLNTEGGGVWHHYNYVLNC